MAKKRKKKSLKKVLILLFSVVLLLGIGGYFAVRTLFGSRPIAPAASNDKAIVHTVHGDLRGSIIENVYQFLGVEYAAAKARFMLAEPVSDWTGVKDAVSVGPVSPQSSMLGMRSNTTGSTNCQNLNLWTPGINDGAKRPVMVWLHGGGMSTGSANDQSYNGAALAAYGDVVVIGVNHRLGLSGFLDLSAYGDQYQYSANAGVDDMVKALEWIHENIEAFGGDPDNVTIFGQSGGGAKVLALMTAPRAKGLFHRAIVQSGATDTLGVQFITRQMSQDLTENILSRLGISAETIETLQSMDLSALESAANAAMQDIADKYKIPAPLSDGYAMEWGAVVDGDYLPTQPVLEDGFAESGKDVPLLIGSNLNEWTVMMPGTRNAATEEIRAAFKVAYPEKSEDSASRVDTLIRLPMLKIMKHKADQGGASVYAYVFTNDDGMRGAYHGAEISYVFHHEKGTLGDQMTQLWVNFARTGVPSAEGVPAWEPYTWEDGATMLLDHHSTLVHGHDLELMKLLKPAYTF